MLYEPISAHERSHTLDVLRGAALLGILLMNILVFGLPSAAYSNANVWGGRDAPNLWTLAIQWTVFEGKMRALFSIMFGAGIVVFMERAVARENSVRAADLYVRRMLWLMAFGVVHGWLIWHGDILYSYALCGLLIFPMRNASPRALFITASVALVLLLALATRGAFERRSVRDAAVAARAAEAQGRTLTQDEKDARLAWDRIWNRNLPPQSELQKEIDDYRGGYVSTFRQRVKVLRAWNFVPAYLPGFADSWALMLIGMGLLKTGVLQGARSRRFYVRMAVISYAIGLPLNALSAYGMISSNFDPVATMFWNAPHQLGRAAVALGHMAVIVLLVKQGAMLWLGSRLAAVGQMALSNYIATSITCALLFYTPGFGLMGQLQRYQLYFVVLGIWSANLAWSPWLLRRFRFGPLEWCWRSLTYWRRQPMLRAVQPIALDQAGVTTA